MSLGEKTQNIGNINTVKVSIFNANDDYISGHSERGSAKQQQQTAIGIDGVLRTADSDEHNYCSHSSTAQMGVSNTHGVAC